MTFRIKACGLNEMDTRSLKSMLALAADMLSHSWVISDDDLAELKIYCFDYPEGQNAWGNRKDIGHSALLTSHGNVTEAVDIIIKKPLRTANFSEALNLIDDQIREQKTPKKVLPTAPPETPKKHSQWRNTFQKLLLAKRKPASDLPPLNITIARIEVAKKADTITDPALLATWLQQLPADPHQKVSTLLSHLQLLSSLDLPLPKNLPLLEEYRQTLSKMLFERDTATVRADSRQMTEKRKFLRQFQLSLHNLAEQYLRCALQQYQRGQRPAEDDDYLFCLIRGGELLALEILHAFQHYLTPPAGLFRQLHQLYLYLEAADCLKRVPTSKNTTDVGDFYTLYTQILLTGIADPYSMPRFAVSKLFFLLAAMTNETAISLLTDKQMHITSQFLLTGHFCIDCLSDHIPQAMARTESRIRSANTTRMLNCQGLLQHLDKIIKQKQQLSAIEQRLMHQAIPQLNGSYERSRERIPITRERTVGVNYGLISSHALLNGNALATQQQWSVINDGDEGLMLRRKTADCNNIHIGDLLTITEPPASPILGSVRWLHIDKEQTTIGLSLIPGKISAAFCTPDGEAKQLLTLILDDVEKPSLITEKGLYSPKRKLRLKISETPSLVEAGQLYDSTLDYDFFSYKALKIS